MKKFYYLVAGILSMGMLASCSNEDEIAAGNQGGDKMGAYLTLTLVGANTGDSRTQTGEDRNEAGETTPVNENTISSALVLLCDANGVVQSKHETSVATVSGSDYMQTERIQVNTLGTYNVYVIANPGSVTTQVKTVEVDGEDNATDINDFVISGITADGMTGTNGFASTNNFLMFNECNGKDDTAGASITVGTENTYDNPATNADAIKLDRLAAKIRYDENEDGVNIDAAKVVKDGQENKLTAITFDGIALINGIKTTYLQQHWGKATATATAAQQYDNILLTPTVTTDNDNSFYYRWDYYSEIDPRGAELNEYTVVRDLIKDITPSPFTTDNLYCMENNSFATANDCFASESDRQGNTTGVLFKATATLSSCDEFTIGEGESQETIKCFYGYNGEFFATLQALAQKYTTLFASGADAAKTELQTALASEDADALSDFRLKYDLHVYENCVMYYTHYIKDQNYIAAKGSATAAPYHSVMRNTIYDLIIDRVKGIGDDVPGGWNPDTDPDKPVDEPTYLQVRCVVNPWVLSSYHIDLQ